MRATPRRDRMLRKADRVAERDRLLRGKTQMRAGIRISSGRCRRRRSMAVGVRLRIIRHTAGNIRRAIVRAIPAAAPVMAIQVLLVPVMGIRERHLRDIWATG